MFLEATGEVYQRGQQPVQELQAQRPGYVGRLRGYRDITESMNLDVGTSFAHGHNDAGPDVTTQLFGIDATLRYRPLQEALYKKAFCCARSSSGAVASSRSATRTPSAPTSAASTS